MKILISINCFAVGGAQTFVIRLANYLSQNNEVFVYDHEHSRGEPKLIKQLNNTVHYHTFKLTKFQEKITWKLNSVLKKVFPAFSIFNYLKNQHFKNFLKKIKPDVINSHIFGSDIVVTKNNSHKIPLVISMHGCYESYWERDDFIDEARQILLEANAIIYAARKNLRIFEKLNLPELDAIYKENIYYGFFATKHQTFVKETLKIDSNDIVFGLVARGIESKGWEESISAFIELRKKFSNIHLVLVSEETNYIAITREKYKNTQGIYFVGFTNNPLEWIAVFDVGLLPTYFPGESLPNTIIEYLYANKPVIATNIGEIKNMLKAGEKQDYAGLLIELNDENKIDYVDLKNLMNMYLVDSNNLLNKHTELSKLALEKFDMQLCAEKYLSVFEKVINENDRKTKTK